MAKKFLFRRLQGLPHNPPTCKRGLNAQPVGTKNSFGLKSFILSAALDYEQGQRYPLVIQTHGFSPHKFEIEGPFATAFAAQPLAAHNIAVLQMDIDYSGSDCPHEVDRELGRLEGAIDYLDKRGLIDRNRIGLVGFSRSCLHVKFALTVTMVSHWFYQ